MAVNESRKNRKRASLKTTAPGGLARHYELYLELANALREGTYLAGDALPSEPDLMRRFLLSRSTVRRALKRLEQEGRIVRRHGSGTYALPSTDSERMHFGLSSLLESCRTLERTTSTRWLQFGQTPTPPRVLKFVPEFGPAALQLQRVRLLKGRPIAMLSSFVRPNWSDGLTKKAIGNRSVIIALINLGATFSILQQFYGAIAADRLQSKSLEVPLGTALLQLTSLFRETAGHITHAEEWLIRPDQVNLNSILEVGQAG